MTAAHAPKLRVLFVDDEENLRHLMKNEMPRRGYEITTAADGPAALEALQKNDKTFDAAIVDLRMPGMSGWDVIDYLQQHHRDLQIVISTGHGNVEDVIHALRLGVYDFVPKPFKVVEIEAALKRIAEKRDLTNKNVALETRLRTVEGSPDLIGTTPIMQQVKRLIDKIAPTDSNVLILGETGTGKELVARRVHDLSRRANKPFVAVNCGALPENLVESELFGHRKGAFTGADQNRKGLIEVANGGTLFLDEMGDLDKAMQVKLLRFLESGEVRPLGSNEALQVDVRVVCATHRDLPRMVREETFREDLYFRINTFEVRLPALRERRDDIRELALSLIARHMKRPSISPEMLPDETLEVLKANEWRGNVRQLANALEHAVIMSNGPIRPEDLPADVLANAAKAPAAATPTVATIGPATFSAPALSRADISQLTLREIEREAIYQALELFQGDKPKAAQHLGISLKTLYNKLNGEQKNAAG